MPGEKVVNALSRVAVCRIEIPDRRACVSLRRTISHR
jgi:hypothetical protein